LYKSTTTFSVLSLSSTRLSRKYDLAMYKTPKAILKESTEKVVVDLYKGGKSINYIMKNTEFGYFRIYRILSNSDIEISRTNKVALPKSISDKIIELRQSGEKIKNIGKLVGVSNPKISEFLREYQNGI
jgi:hypothetical protein